VNPRNWGYEPPFARAELAAGSAAYPPEK